jgi:multidrug efflux pump subunit AcrA (membrane-fusion protein)
MNPRRRATKAATNRDRAGAEADLRRQSGVGIVAIVVVTVVLAGWGILSRRSANTVLAERTTELAAPSVIAVVPKQGAPVDSFVLPGNVTAYTDSPIYARTSGYLTKWYFDIGARVKKGALLAEIATPELDQQLAQAEADLVTAQSSAGNANAGGPLHGTGEVGRGFQAGYRHVRQPGCGHIVRGEVR